jgi:triacylglycerol esterase/lipase EstA (alpha/beta hydrolase family)
MLDKLECRHVKQASYSKKKSSNHKAIHLHIPLQIRLLIKAVSRYARSQVDVLGHSMGSPLARKVSLRPLNAI